MYFWLMAQILIFYAVVVLTICFFFRKFCGDPALDESDDEGEVANRSPKKSSKKNSPEKKLKAQQ
jgi:hypothetical protein